MENRTKILVVRHYKEALKSTNTARLASLALTNMEIVDYGKMGAPFDPGLLEGEDIWTLFPDSGRSLPEKPPRTLVVLDGTWSQVRQMSHRVPRLSTLPRLSLAMSGAPTLRLRRPPHPDGMATIEAIALALSALEGPALGEPLLALHERYVEAVLRARGAWREDGRDGLPDSQLY